MNKNTNFEKSRVSRSNDKEYGNRMGLNYEEKTIKPFEKLQRNIRFGSNSKSTVKIKKSRNTDVAFVAKTEDWRTIIDKSFNGGKLVKLKESTSQKHLLSIDSVKKFDNIKPSLTETK